MADALDEIVDEICNEICAQAGEEGLSTMMSMCGNAGQESIIGTAAGDYLEAASDCSEGEPGDFSTDHEEAVGIITDVGREFLQAAAAQCQQVRAAAAIADIL